MSFTAILSLLSTAWDLVSPLVTLADQAATASGNQKLEFVTGAILKAHTIATGVEADVAAAKPLVQSIVSDFADLFHAGKAAVANVKAEVSAIQTEAVAVVAAPPVA